MPIVAAPSHWAAEWEFTCSAAGLKRSPALRVRALP